MNRPNHRRPHHRVGEKQVQQQSQEKSIMEFDIKKTSIIIAIFCFIQGWLIGLAMNRK
ncbi:MULTISPECIES: hypothetical protein [Vallitalea]|uniref:Uncharacterized protein n=2 Tax=Vallitalea TaxID=1348611 RepID=A0A8J8MEG0_9FIRM|nr:hypothetical protein [Vallitalea guaymasensis]QUH31407.1 hypothetical protein HYG85_21770 [Vallitalea guaymasensis]GMQ65070.1 hypothetical protein AN2V17_43120 [Vallitalea sp. AN17-2]